MTTRFVTRGLFATPAKAPTKTGPTLADQLAAERRARETAEAQTAQLHTVLLTMRLAAEKQRREEAEIRAGELRLAIALDKRMELNHSKGVAGFAAALRSQTKAPRTRKAV